MFLCKMPLQRMMFSLSKDILVTKIQIFALLGIQLQLIYDRVRKIFCPLFSQSTFFVILMYKVEKGLWTLQSFITSFSLLVTTNKSMLRFYMLKRWQVFNLCQGWYRHKNQGDKNCLISWFRHSDNFNRMSCARQ